MMLTQTRRRLVHSVNYCNRDLFPLTLQIHLFWARRDVCKNEYYQTSIYCQACVIEMMLDALRWFIAIEMIGLVAFPLAHYLFPRLPDRGYSLAKPLGLLIIAYSSWILSIYHIVPHGTLSILLIVSAMALASLLYSRSNIDKLKSFLIVRLCSQLLL